MRWEGEKMVWCRSRDSGLSGLWLESLRHLWNKALSWGNLFYSKRVAKGCVEKIRGFAVPSVKWACQLGPLAHSSRSGFPVHSCNPSPHHWAHGRLVLARPFLCSPNLILSVHLHPSPMCQTPWHIANSNVAWSCCGHPSSGWHTHVTGLATNTTTHRYVWRCSSGFRQSRGDLWCQFNFSLD